MLLVTEILDKIDNGSTSVRKQTSNFLELMSIPTNNILREEKKMKTKEKGRIQVGIDKELKENAEQILEELGLNATTAITILYKQVVSRGEFPMEIKLSEEEKQAIKLRQLTQNMPVQLLDTHEKVNEWFNGDE